MSFIQCLGHYIDECALHKCAPVINTIKQCNLIVKHTYLCGSLQNAQIISWPVTFLTNPGHQTLGMSCMEIKSPRRYLFAEITVTMFI
jgi:hypothetical protein